MPYVSLLTNLLCLGFMVANHSDPAQAEDIKCFGFHARMHSSVYPPRQLWGVAYLSKDYRARICSYWQEPSREYKQLADSLAYCDILLTPAATNVWLHHNWFDSTNNSNILLQFPQSNDSHIMDGDLDSRLSSLLYLALTYESPTQASKNISLPPSWPSTWVQDHLGLNNGPFVMPPRSAYPIDLSIAQGPDSVWIERFPPYGRIFFQDFDQLTQERSFFLYRLLDDEPIVTLTVSPAETSPQALAEAFQPETLGAWSAVPSEFRAFWTSLSQFRAIYFDGTVNPDRGRDLMSDIQAQRSSTSDLRLKMALSHLAMQTALLSEDVDLLLAACADFAEVVLRSSRKAWAIGVMAELEQEFSRLGWSREKTLEFFSRLVSELRKAPRFDGSSLNVLNTAALQLPGGSIFASLLRTRGTANQSSQEHSEADAPAVLEHVQEYSRPLTSQEITLKQLSRIVSDITRDRCSNMVELSDGHEIEANLRLVLESSSVSCNELRIQQMVNDFFSAYGCASNLEDIAWYVDNLSWLLLLTLADDSTAADHEVFRGQLETMAVGWIESALQATEILGHDKAQIGEQIGQVMTESLEKTVEPMIGSALWPMLKRPLNAPELEQVELQAQRLARRTLALLKDRNRPSARGNAVKPLQRPAQLNPLILATSELFYNTLIWRIIVLRLPGEFASAQMKGNRLHVDAFGPAFPDDPEAAREAFRTVQRWFSAVDPANSR